MSDIAKVFWSGRSQAVRLPKAYRFDTEAVRIRREGDAVILEPVAESWDLIAGKLQPFDDDAVAAMEEEVPQQERPELDDL
ncbi:antitoxin [Methylobacterium dankookense]|uniref:Antitoxin VapB1 n=1 Tax=Methylobacterium dankookense TaxID=560405 RepID=A0A564G1W5_9HYPH|nr:type II toxin-antitoxin system VapB family antitoxin [Methylobacterium dankookense]GJD56171.1 Antitoxin VapB1 [Methylobacterium dankookense]VUF13960.1 Antitoxin VapB1 [Methylobacterium dankookense]